MILNKEHEDKLRHFGKFYGYPDCCIEEFVILFGKRDSSDKRKFHGTGYIPCSNCNKKSEAQLLANINAARKCLVPFSGSFYV